MLSAAARLFNAARLSEQINPYLENILSLATDVAEMP
jgi:hypothetical protein